MTLEQQRDILDHTFKLLTDFNHGVPPKGSVAPWWETSKEGTALLLEKGIEYGYYISLLISNEVLTPFKQTTPICATSESVYQSWNTQTYIFSSSQMYYLRDEDIWTKIDYQAKAHTWMKPLQRGKETGLVEIPGNWSVKYIINVFPLIWCWLYVR